MSISNLKYIDQKINAVNTDRLNALIRVNNEYLNHIAPAIKETFNNYAGKVCNKRVVDALKAVDNRLRLTRSDYWPNKWSLELYYDYNYTIYIFNYIEIERIDAAALASAIDQSCIYQQGRVADITDDLKNYKRKIKKLAKIADEFNQLIDSMSVYTLESAGIKYNNLYI